MKDNDLGRSPGGDGLSQAEPVSAVSALRASIPSAEAVAMWQCAMSTPVECVDRLRAKWAKRRNRSKVLQEFDGELDDLLQFLMDRRHKNAPDSYPGAFAYHKALNMLVASGIEARSDETAQQAQPEGQEPGPKGTPKPLSQEMIMSEAENPPAFPSVCLNDPCHEASVPGMSLRDWFAGQALAGFLANGSQRALNEAHKEEPDFLDLGPSARAEVINRQLAIGSYQIADAMLSARHPTQEQG